MAARCGGTNAAGKWSDSSPGYKISAAYWYAMNPMPRITWVLSSLVVPSSSCGGIYEMASSLPDLWGRVILGPHVVLIDRRTNQILDVLENVLSVQ
jgi:hypothetical protein